MKFKFFILLFFAVCLSKNSICQGKYSGTIINNKTKKAIPYATIGLIKENVGISCDSNGHFTILSIYPYDSLLITSVGYEKKIIPLHNKPSEYLEIVMEEKKFMLKDVIVNKKMNDDVTLNDFNSCSSNFFLQTSRSSHLLALPYEAPVENMLLSELAICKEVGDCFFRIHIYTKDSITGEPSKELNDTIIEVRSSKRKVIIDMEKYNVVIPGKEFYVAIEWVIIPLNIAETRTDKFGERKLTYISYKPGISFKYMKNKSNSLSSGKKNWFLNYNGKWTDILNDYYSRYDFLISAKMKY